MIKIGSVEQVFALHENWIFAVKVIEKTEVCISPDDVLMFENCGKTVLNGVKFWPERGGFDLLINHEFRKPQFGEAVYTSS